MSTGLDAFLLLLRGNKIGAVLHAAPGNHQHLQMRELLLKFSSTMPKRTLPVYAEMVLSELQQEAAFEKQSIDDDCPSTPQGCPLSNPQSRRTAVEVSE